MSLWKLGQSEYVDVVYCCVLFDYFIKVSVDLQITKYINIEYANHIRCNLIITLMLGAKQKERYKEMSVITK